MQWQIPNEVEEDRRRIAPEAVMIPQHHEGVGNALRSAYLPRISDMPRGMAALLDQLN